MKAACMILLISMTLLSVDASFMERLFKKPVQKRESETWHKFQDKSYLIAGDANHEEVAEKVCKDKGGELAIIESAEENDFIAKNVLKRIAWIGLRRNEEHEFYWIDGFPLEGTFSAWGRGEPNNVKEECALMSKAGKWDDVFCTTPAIYKSADILCQKRTPNTWYVYEDTSYLIAEPIGDWDAARKVCQDMGADLATIKSLGQNRFTRDILKGSVWFGLHREAHNQFYWVDGSALGEGFSSWNAGEPNNIKEKCAMTSNSGKWDDVFCITPSIYKPPFVLCQKKSC